MEWDKTVESRLSSEFCEGQRDPQGFRGPRSDRLRHVLTTPSRSSYNDPLLTGLQLESAERATPNPWPPSSFQRGHLPCARWRTSVSDPDPSIHPRPTARFELPYPSPSFTAGRSCGWERARPTGFHQYVSVTPPISTAFGPLESSRWDQCRSR